jgi:hypothetical protein
MISQGREGAEQAVDLYIQYETIGTTRVRYVMSVIESVLRTRLASPSELPEDMVKLLAQLRRELKI